MQFQSEAIYWVYQIKRHTFMTAHIFYQAYSFILLFLGTEIEPVLRINTKFHGNWPTE